MKKILLGILPWAVIGVVAYFFIDTLAKNWHNVQNGNFTLNAWAIIGVVFLVAAVVVSGALWGRLLTTLSGVKVSAADAVKIHAASWLLKYVPGQVGSLINKLAWSRKQGISQKATVTSFVYENVLTVLASVILSIPLAFVIAETSGLDAGLLLPLLLLLPILLILYRPIFYGILNAVFKKLGRKPFRKSDFLTSRGLVGYWLSYLLPRVLNGVGFVFVAASLLPVEPHMYVSLAATYILASIVGLLAIFVPGGIGVREAIIVVFASIYFPVEQAIILSIVARLYATVADAGVGVIYFVLNKGRIRQR